MAGILSLAQQQQREYVKSLDDRGFNYSVVMAEAFVQGIRDLGYKSTGTALDELVDNSIDANATAVNIAFGYGEDSTNKPQALAVIDNGDGMIPDMIRASCLWGGTHRHNERTGFGRYGYGLPSACVSIGRRYSVYSKEKSGDWNKVTVDLDDIQDGKYNHDGNVRIPEAEKSELPVFVRNYIHTHSGAVAKSLPHGTVVVIEKLDRINWKTSGALKEHLGRHFGTVYRNYLRNTPVHIDGVSVQPIDPLFTTESCKGYAVDNQRATPVPSFIIDVNDKVTKQAIGQVRIRMATFPAGFGAKVKSKKAAKGNTNVRYPVMKENRGFQVCRKGRQIDTVSAKIPGMTMANYDEYWGCEIDFDPTLDEDFAITTSKQQVVISDRIWDLLNQQGLMAAITKMRQDVKKSMDSWRGKQSEAKSKTLAEQAKQEADSERRMVPLSPEEIDEAEANQLRAIEDLASTEKITKTQAKQEIEGSTKANPYLIEEEDVPGGSFYRPERRGSQLIVWINRDHPFFSDVFNAKDMPEMGREGIKLLLLALCEAESRAPEAVTQTYQTERQEWSKTLRQDLFALGKLHYGGESSENESGDDMDNSDALVQSSTSIVEEVE